MKKKLLKSLQDINIHKNEELDQKADQATIHGEASTVIKDWIYEENYSKCCITTRKSF